MHSTNCRLFFTAGDRAINLASTSINSLRSVANLLSTSSSPSEVLSSIQRINDTNAELRRKEKGLLTEIAKYEGDRVRAALTVGEKAFVYRSSGGLDFLNMVVFEIKELVKERGVVVLTAGEGRMGGPIVVVGEKAAVEKTSLKIKNAMPEVRGGGSNGRWQGKVLSWKKGEVEALEKLIVED